MHDDERGRSLALAVGLGAAMGAAAGAATGHVGVWVGVGIAAYIAITFFSGAGGKRQTKPEDNGGVR